MDKVEVEVAERTVSGDAFSGWQGVFAAAITFVLQGCGGSSGGDEIIVGKPVEPTIECRTYVVDKDYATAADSNDGRYAQDGGSGPWRTIQHAVDSVEPCDTIHVRAAATPYTEIGEQLFGIVIQRGGEKDKPITIEGYPGERPVLDQQRDGNSSSLISGFMLNCVSWITLRNFEIRNVADAGVSSSLNGCASSELVLENLNIHHVYGGNLAAAIRLASVSGVHIRNNTLSDILKAEANDSAVFVASYVDTQQIDIQNNTIFSTEVGVLFALQSTNRLIDTTVNHNVFYDTETALQFSSWTTGGAFDRADFYANLVYGTEEVISAEMDNTNAPSRQFEIYNNTFADVGGAAIVIDNIVGVSIYNDIFARVNAEYLFAGSAVVFDYIDHNIYWSDDAAGWVLAAAEVPRTYTTFDEWRSAYSSEAPQTLRADPDKNSLLFDPQFIDSEQHDFRLKSDSSVRTNGRDGSAMGAYIDDAQILGSGG